MTDERRTTPPAPLDLDALSSQFAQAPSTDDGCCSRCHENVLWDIDSSSDLDGDEYCDECERAIARTAREAVPALVAEVRRLGESNARLGNEACYQDRQRRLAESARDDAIAERDAALAALGRVAAAAFGWGPGHRGTYDADRIVDHISAEPARVAEAVDARDVAWVRACAASHEDGPSHTVNRALECRPFAILDAARADGATDADILAAIRAARGTP